MSGDGVTAMGVGMARVSACLDIWRSLSVLLGPNGILLMPPTQQRPGQFRRRTVAYITTEFDGYIIGFTVGFTCAAVDPGRRLAVQTENNRICFNGRPLHTSYRKVPFSVRSRLVVIGLGLLRLNAHPDIWSGLLVLNGILLMPPTQQRPGQLRRRAVAYVATEFDGYIIGFTVGFTCAAVDPDRWLVVQAEDNRECFNGRPLHAPYREAPFSVRSCLVVLGLGLLRLNAHPVIWRGLSVLNGILLMSPIQQRPEQLRWCAVAYVATEFDGYIIGFTVGFTCAAVDPGRRLAVQAENNRICFNGRPLHTSCREAPFSVRSWLVVLGFGLLRLNAHSDT